MMWFAFTPVLLYLLVEGTRKRPREEQKKDCSSTLGLAAALAFMTLLPTVILLDQGRTPFTPIPCSLSASPSGLRVPGSGHWPCGPWAVFSAAISGFSPGIGWWTPGATDISGIPGISERWEPFSDLR